VHYKEDEMVVRVVHYAGLARAYDEKIPLEIP
jgi:hypothetical protein